MGVISAADMARIRRGIASDDGIQPIRFSKIHVNQAVQVGIEDWYTSARSVIPTESVSASIDSANTALGAGALSPGWTNSEKKVLERHWLPWKGENI